MPTFKILHYPHVLLRKKSSPVEKFTPDLGTFVESMKKTMYDFEGIGLAAPQVGILKRIFVVDISPYLKNSSLKSWHGEIRFLKAGKEQALEWPLTLVNPEIVETKDEVSFPFDGCLSLPGLSKSQTSRHRWIRLKAKDEQGVDLEIACDGIMSICLQHEFDHLEGVLFIDHLQERADAKDITAEIEEFENAPEERRRLRKLKLVDARNEKYAFL